VQCNSFCRFFRPWVASPFFQRESVSDASLHFPEIRSMSINWKPCPARWQGRGCWQSKILSSILAETAIGCADGPAFTASLYGRDESFTEFSPPADPAFKPLSCPGATKKGIPKVKGGKPVGDLHRSFCCARLPEYCGLFSALKPVVEDGIDCR